jgi:integrase
MKKGKKDLIVVNNKMEASISRDDYMNQNISGYIYQTGQETIDNEELQKQIIQGAVYKETVDKALYNYKISTIDLNREIDDFFNRSDKTIVTKRLYKYWLQLFLSWCKEKNIDCLKITRMEAENYLYYINTIEYKQGKRYSSSSIHSMIMAVCSFYNELQLRYAGIILINPFHKLRLPKIRLERRKDKVNDNDIKVLKEKLKSIGRYDIICAIDIFCHYGYRVGIFEKMRLQKDGYWTAVSKGHDMEGKFTKRETERIFETKLLEVRKCTIQNTILKYTQRLYKKGKITCPFSCHDIRHFHITKEINKLPEGKKLIEISRRFHKNLNTTMRYYDD